MPYTTTIKINDRGPDHRIVYVSSKGDRVTAPPGEYKATAESPAGPVVIAGEGLEFSLSFDEAVAYHRRHLISGWLPFEH